MTTNPIQGGCCNACSGFRGFCTSLFCPCHSKPQDIQQGWEKEFDEEFPEFGYPRGTRNDRMKDFIRAKVIPATLQDHKQRILEGLPKEKDIVMCLCLTECESVGFNEALSQARKVVEES